MNITAFPEETNLDTPRLYFSITAEFIIPVDKMKP
jgi:hypothetical protein